MHRDLRHVDVQLTLHLNDAVDETADPPRPGAVVSDLLPQRWVHLVEGIGLVLVAVLHRLNDLVRRERHRRAARDQARGVSMVMSDAAAAPRDGRRQAHGARGGRDLHGQRLAGQGGLHGPVRILLGVDLVLLEIRLDLVSPALPLRLARHHGSVVHDERIGQLLVVRGQQGTGGRVAAGAGVLGRGRGRPARAAGAGRAARGGAARSRRAAGRAAGPGLPARARSARSRRASFSAGACSARSRRATRAGSAGPRPAGPLSAGSDDAAGAGDSTRAGSAGPTRRRVTAGAAG